MSRRSGRRKGRPYQPYPERSSSWVVRFLVIFVGMALVIALVAITFIGK